MAGYDLESLRAEDDTPVLAYADWVQEHGDEARAEFIRLQCQSARSPVWAEGYTAAAVRADALLVRNVARWSAELDPLYAAGLRPLDVGLFNLFHASPGADPEPLNDLERCPLFDRGLLAKIVLTPENLSAHAGRLYAALPTRHLVLAYNRPPARPLGPDDLRPIRSLGIEQPSMACDLSWLEPALQHQPGHLRSLSVRCESFTPESVSLLARSEALGGVRRLELPVDDASLAGLAGRVKDLGLESLTLTGEFSADHLPVLLSGRTGKTLRSLRLCPLSGRADGHVAAVVARTLPALESLDLRNTSLDSASIDRLTDSPNLPSLIDVNLEGCRIRNHSRLALPLGAGRRPLARLSLKGCKLPPRCLTSLFQSPAAAGLQWLDLGKNEVSDPTLLALVRSPMARTLRWLRLGSTPAGDKSVTALAAASFPQLEALDLSVTGITETGVVAVLESASLPQLRSFKPGSVSVGPAGLRRIVAGPRLGSLVEWELVLDVPPADLDLLANRKLVPNLRRWVLGLDGAVFRSRQYRRLEEVYRDVLVEE